MSTQAEFKTEWPTLNQNGEKVTFSTTGVLCDGH